MLRLARRRPCGPALWGLGLATSCHIPALTKRQSPDSTRPRCVGGGELLHKKPTGSNLTAFASQA